jgi:tRNA-splicing ligase RtcB
LIVLSVKDIPLKQINKNIWEIPKDFRPYMRVPARIIANEFLIKDIYKDKTLIQAANITSLPGIKKFSVTLPDS